MTEHDTDVAAEPRTGSDEKPPRRRRGCAGLFIACMLVMGAAWGAGLGYFVHLMYEAEKTLARADLQSFRPKVGSKVWSGDNPPVLLHEFAVETRQVVPLNEIPLHLQKAFVAGEDHIFFQHKGVRPDAIGKAFLYIYHTGRLRGGSTITQQLVRNVDRTGVSTERTFSRKLDEALIALQIERQFTKDEILELYLNQIFLGISAWGVEAASQQYFNKSCRDLTLAESALLAGINPSPHSFEPFRHPDIARVRRKIVLDKMLKEGFITREEYDEAVNASLDDSIVTPEERKELQERSRVPWESAKAGYFVEEVRRYVSQSNPVSAGRTRDGENPVFESGLQIYTTIDTRLQAIAERVMKKHQDAFDEKKRKRLEASGRMDEFQPISGALVCIDNRPGYQGYVRAMVGGRDFTREKFNLATQARRQPGSSIKPFIWAAAMEQKGFTADSVIVDEPYVKRVGNSVWAPKNFSGTYRGPVTLEQALQYSINTVSIRLAVSVGIPQLRSYFEKVGITTPIDPLAGETIALGSSVVTVLDHCRAYSVFPNGGWLYAPVLVREIRDRDGLVLYSHKPNPRQVMREDVAYNMIELMETVATRGTGAGTRALDRPRAGKTGTSNEARDTWFCGFTPDFTCVVWFGYEDNTSLGDYTGGGLAVPAWTDFMVEAHTKDLPPRPFPKPERNPVREAQTDSGAPETVPARPAASDDPIDEDELLGTL